VITFKLAGEGDGEAAPAAAEPQAAAAAQIEGGLGMGADSGRVVPTPIGRPADLELQREDDDARQEREDENAFAKAFPWLAEACQLCRGLTVNLRRLCVTCSTLCPTRPRYHMVGSQDGPADGGVGAANNNRRWGYGGPLMGMGGLSFVAGVLYYYLTSRGGGGRHEDAITSANRTNSTEGG